MTSLETLLDSVGQRAYLPSMTKTAEITQFAGLAELVKQVQAGNEVVLTEGHKPVAKIVSTATPQTEPGAKLKIRSFKGHRVLTPIISQSEIAEEMFGRQ